MVLALLARDLGGPRETADRAVIQQLAFLGAVDLLPVEAEQLADGPHHALFGRVVGHEGCDDRLEALVVGKRARAALGSRKLLQHPLSMVDHL